MHILSVYFPQSVIAWVIIGLIAGLLAGTVSLASPTSIWAWWAQYLAAGFLKS
jgi:hypothetical protein